MRPLCIFGAGGCAREALLVARRLDLPVFGMMDRPGSSSIDGKLVFPETLFDPRKHSAFVALGKPARRKRVVESLMKLKPAVDFPVLVDPAAILMNRDSITIGHGSLVCAHSVLTCNISLGSWSLINVASRLGHDLTAGDFFTTAYGVNVSGRNVFGRSVMLGAGVSTRDGVVIGNEILVGVGAAVVSDLLEPGTYVGVPAKRLERTS